MVAKSPNASQEGSNLDPIAEEGNAGTKSFMDNSRAESAMKESVLGSQVNDGLDEAMGSSSAGDGDEYTKMLIRQELEKKMGDIEAKVEELVANNAAATGPRPSSRLEGQGEDSGDHFAEFEATVQKQFLELDMKIIKILAQMRIIRMVQDSIKVKKNKEDDPLYPEFSNFNNKISEEKVHQYLSMPGNSFDKDLNKLLKKFQRKRDGSSESVELTFLNTPNATRGEN